ncbi:hypothetical protein [Rhizobium sp. Root708]|nr:hypothetical protein [Rhizobium sp. Root708]
MKHETRTTGPGVLAQSALLRLFAAAVASLALWGLIAWAVRLP